MKIKQTQGNQNVRGTSVECRSRFQARRWHAWMALALGLMMTVTQAHALLLCAPADPVTGKPREGSSIKLRSQCRDRETVIGTTEESATLREIRARVDENRVDIDANSEAIEMNFDGVAPGRSEVARPMAGEVSRPMAIDAPVANCGMTITADNAVFNACNVHVRSGEGRTWGASDLNDPDGTVNGRGNLIVGYNEGVADEPRGGSHNLVVGPYHSYPSYGGLLAGIYNRANQPFSSVSGGSANIADGWYSSVTGGDANTASGEYASVSGGSRNTASGEYASVSGGGRNTASGVSSSVSGGDRNTASGGSSSVSGGDSNAASGEYAAVSGGRRNVASGRFSSVQGGSGNEANGSSSSVSGGRTM